MTSRTIKTPHGYDVRLFDNGMWRHIPTWRKPHMGTKETISVCRYLNAEWFPEVIKIDKKGNAI